ncbi:VOC family protein [Streptococcus sp. ZJ93]|uniref:VOC family protein n=1 Tax=Streptococcus handemini TaxID=3161188 RepID=UPI0032EC15B4
MIITSTTMLYVENTIAAMEFWIEKMGFVLLDTADYGDAISYEIVPSLDAATRFGIHGKEWVAKANPGMTLSFPSLLFEAEDLKSEYERLTQAGISTNPIMEYQGMVHFTFSDNEGHYIAMRENTAK